MKIANRDAREFVQKQHPFEGSNMFAEFFCVDPKDKTEGQSGYVVYSFGKHFPMYICLHLGGTGHLVCQRGQVQPDYHTAPEPSPPHLGWEQDALAVHRVDAAHRQQGLHHHCQRPCSHREQAMTKDELIEQHREWNVEDDDWWDCTYANFKVSMTAIGIEVDKMYFSGFWSQGDGACFAGRVSDWDLFLRSLGYTDNVLIQHAIDHFSFSVRHSGYYSHENCTVFNADLCTPDSAADEDFAERYGPYPWGTDDIRTKAWVALLNQYDSTKLEDEFEEAFKEHMRQLYKNLEEEYDYLTSDEVVWESLEANGMTTELNQPEEEEA